MSRISQTAIGLSLFRRRNWPGRRFDIFHNGVDAPSLHA
jgi:hypothetical protein